MIVSRPLTIAEIFDRTVTIVVQRWRIVAAFAALDATPSAAITASTRGHDQTGPAAALQLIVSVLVGALAFSPLVRLGGEPGVPDDVGILLRRAVRDFGRSLGTLLLEYAAVTVVFAGAAAIVLAAFLGMRALAGTSAALVTSIVIALLIVPLMIPLFLVANVAYANVILEEVGPWRGVMSALSRVGTNGWRRTWLLGAALSVASLTPIVAMDTVLRGLATSTGMWWLVLVEPYVGAAVIVAFGTVAGAVAAVDYRNRRDGADLHAVLDTAPPAS
jgi:hypothetical protein